MGGLVSYQPCGKEDRKQCQAGANDAEQQEHKEWVLTAHAVVGVVGIMYVGQQVMLTAHLLFPVQQVVVLPHHCRAPQLVSFHPDPHPQSAMLLQAEAEAWSRQAETVCMWYPT